MKNLVDLLLAFVVLLSACSTVPGSASNQPTTIPPTPVTQPGLLEFFSVRRLVLDKLVVQGNPIAVPAGFTAYLNFSQDGKVTGSGGCNRFFGDFTNTTPGQVKFGALGSTKMYCQDRMEIENGLFNALDKVSRYRVDGTRLMLESDDGQYTIEFYEPTK